MERIDNQVGRILVLNRGFSKQWNISLLLDFCGIFWKTMFWRPWIEQGLDFPFKTWLKILGKILGWFWNFMLGVNVAKRSLMCNRKRVRSGSNLSGTSELIWWMDSYKYTTTVEVGCYPFANFRKKTKRRNLVMSKPMMWDSPWNYKD